MSWYLVCYAQRNGHGVQEMANLVTDVPPMELVSAFAIKWPTTQPVLVNYWSITYAQVLSPRLSGYARQDRDSLRRTSGVPV